jgi:hypothetical protein
MATRYDLVVIGGGSGGLTAATIAADAMIQFNIAAAPTSETEATIVLDDVLKAALTAAVGAVKLFAAEAAREFGIGSAPVFSKYLREATSPLRDVIPVAALTGRNGVVDVDVIWQALSNGARIGRDLAVRAVVESILAGAVRAAAETLPPKRVAKTRKAALEVLLKAKPAIEQLALTPSVSQWLAAP